MGPSRQLYLFLTLLAFLPPFILASAQDLNQLNDPISEGQPLHDNVLLFPQHGQLANDKIDGLLVSLKFWSRQQQVTCATNYTICQGTQFCCPNGNTCCSSGTCCGAGTYCTTVGGVQGCCKLGHICSQVTNECTVAGQQRCQNENFCCPPADSCYRDASNNPRCSNSSTPGGVSGLTPTSTITFVSLNPSSTATTESSSQQTTCQLTPSTQKSLFSRRKRASAHPNSKRTGWFW